MTRFRPVPRPKLVLVLVLAVEAAALAPPAAGADPVAADSLAGDWVGWAYLDEGGDLPLRLRLEAGPDGGLAARFDELVSRRYDLPVERVEWAAPRLVLERRRPGGTVILLEGERAGGALRGRLDWAGHEGDFELTRSPERLSRLAAETFEDCQGTYRLSAGSGETRTLVVSSRFWGELLFTDLATGRAGTLFPVDRDRFFAGSAMYVPAPVHTRAAFVRDDEGEVTGLEWTEEATGQALRGERVAFAEEEVAFTADDGTPFAGTLIRPDVPGPLPAVAVLGGSNWGERGTVRPDASVLASFGLAALIYDKRGHGGSGGEETVPFARTAADAVAAVRYLRGRPDVLPDQVGLTGRSRGGWFAPLAASLSDDVAFLVLFVPPAISPAEQETTRRLNLLLGEGRPPEVITRAEEALAEAWRYGATAEGWETYAEARRRAVEAGVPEDLLESDRPDPADWAWIRLNMAHDPVPALERVSVPVLALFGEADRNVVPEENLPRMRAALERAGNRDVELVVVPGADHGLRVRPDSESGAEAGADPVPLHRQVGFGPAGWPTVERWLAERLDVWGSSP